MKKRAQMEMSFGMLFSIILIIVFITFAFYGIKTFLGVQKSAESAKFISDFQTDIDRVWKSAQSSENVDYRLPSAVSRVCFVDFSSSGKGINTDIYSDLKKANFGNENLVFYPRGSTDLESTEIRHIDLYEMTKGENPYCIENNNGKISFVLVKELDSALVKITR